MMMMMMIYIYMCVCVILYLLAQFCVDIKVSSDDSVFYFMEDM